MVTIPYWKICEYLSKLQMHITFDPWIPLLGTYPTEIHAHLHTDMSTRLFITTLFERAKKKKKKYSKCPTTGYWVNYSTSKQRKTTANKKNETDLYELWWKGTQRKKMSKIQISWSLKRLHVPVCSCESVWVYICIERKRIGSTDINRPQWLH